MAGDATEQSRPSSPAVQRYSWSPDARYNIGEGGQHNGWTVAIQRRVIPAMPAMVAAAALLLAAASAGTEWMAQQQRLALYFAGKAEPI